MIYNLKLKRALLFICSVILISVISSCKNKIDTAEIKAANLKADSLSIKLNSPELKGVNALLLKEPNNPDLYYKRASVYLNLQQMHETVGDALRAIKLDSTKAEYYLILGDAYFAQNKTKLAKDVLEIIEKKFPENTEALLKLSELYFLVRQYQKGIDYANKALKVNDNLAKAYYLKANIYRESGDTARAISNLETAAEQDNKFTDAFHDLGVIYAARKNPLALDYYNNVLKINPDDEEVKYARAKLLQDLGKIEEAIAEYENILIKNKNCANCFYNLGAINLEIKKDNKKALEYFTKAIAANPSYPEAYFARGYTYSKLKDKSNAKADYNVCLKLVPNYGPAIQGLNEL